MAHIVLIEDDHNNIVDGNWYCSDGCAQTDDAYAGWYGLVECASETGCVACDQPVA